MICRFFLDFSWNQSHHWVRGDKMNTMVRFVGQVSLENLMVNDGVTRQSEKVREMRGYERETREKKREERVWDFLEVRPTRTHKTRQVKCVQINVKLLKYPWRAKLYRIFVLTLTYVPLAPTFSYWYVLYKMPRIEAKHKRIKYAHIELHVAIRSIFVLLLIQKKFTPQI